MRIDCGKYILLTDVNENMWIEEKFMGKDKDDNPKESTRRVSGYLTKFHQLADDFTHKYICGGDEENIYEVLANLKEAEQEIKIIAESYKKYLDL